ncbi:MAG: hypothetical protein EBU46_18015 [Nitrosomonadaceae bacterium]|nr:hypothetical protein [Nitrosomonadaceae bacterium]
MTIMATKRRRRGSKIKVVEVKLKRQHALGQAWAAEGLVEIDPRQRAKVYLNTLIHELTHILFPEASEHKVRKVSGKYVKALWDAGYRRIAK